MLKKEKKEEKKKQLRKPTIRHGGKPNVDVLLSVVLLAKKMHMKNEGKVTLGEE